MATDFDREYGVFLNKMKYAKEKARYIIDQGFPMIENFYSDSLADTPLALLAEKAHLVTNKASTVTDWPELDEKVLSKVKEKIDTGCTRPGDTHIYVGTSGWVSTFMDHQTVDLNAMITGVLSAIHGHFNYYAELETAGKCLEWVTEHLALDEIGVYLSHANASDVESTYLSLFDFLSAEMGKVPPGANGVLFAPWLHGNRCPFEDSRAGGMFFNVRIENNKGDLLRAVILSQRGGTA